MTKSSSEKPKLLKLVSYDHPILRTKMAPLQFPLTEEDKETIRDMKYSIQAEQLKEAGAPWDTSAGMAANQWGIAKRIFLYCPNGDTINDLGVIINPSYEPVDSLETEDMWEGCFSVPLATGNIKRYQSITVHYQDEQGTKINKQLSGWYARVWQHENDHLDGLLYDDKNEKKCLDKRTFLTKEELEFFYKNLK